ncbi:MAG: hypothetical protein ACKPGK_14440, partial [Verrucomicrobiota bacterium]
GVRVRIDDDGVSTPDVKNNLFWGFKSGSNEDYGKEYAPAALNPVADPKLRSVSRKADGKLDPRPGAGSPVFDGVLSTPADGFWTPVGHKGAFDVDDNWARHWTALDANGFFPAQDNVFYMSQQYLYGTYRWSATNVYILTGFTYVMSNAVLNIEPGTVIKGVSGTGTGASAANDFGCLFVCRGGKLNAVGTANNPIIFTAERDDVADSGDLPFPTRGLWGGIVLFGNARLNNPAWTTNNVSYDIYEGLPDLAVTNAFTGQVDYIHRFGGTDDNDSSGVMRYVSVRHGGKKLTTDKEINGWSLCGVGRGTVAEYLEAYCIADDGFEFFGGSVNTRYLVSAFNDDDGFDTDQGYNGRNQFWFGIQEPGAKDNGSEQNGQPQAPDVRVAGALPLADYVVRNATLIGAGEASSGNDALRFRQENKARWYNSVITDFGGVRVRIDDDGVSTPDVKNNLFWGFKSGSNRTTARSTRRRRATRWRTRCWAGSAGCRTGSWTRRCAPGARPTGCRRRTRPASWRWTSPAPSGPRTGHRTGRPWAPRASSRPPASGPPGPSRRLNPRRPCWPWRRPPAPASGSPLPRSRAAPTRCRAGQI